MNIYLQNETDFEHNGLGFLTDILDINVTDNLNGDYSLFFEYKLKGQLSEYIQNENIVKCKVADGTKQLFIIKSVVKTFNSIQVNCKHIFYQLLDNFLEDVAPTNLNGQTFLKWILDRTKAPNNFNAHSDISTTKSARYVRRNPVDCILGDTDNSMVNLFNGELRRDNFDIHFDKKIGNDNGVKLIIGKNITGISITIDTNSVHTKIMPQGFDGLLLPEKYIDSPLINTYPSPKIYKAEFSDIKYNPEDEEAYHDIEKAYQALRNATNKLYENGIDKPTINVKINWIELSKTNEYKNYSNLEKVGLGDTVTCELLGLTYKTRIIKTVYNPFSERITSFELGTPKADIGTTQNIIQKQLKIIPTSILESAKANATELLTQAMGGYVYKTQNELFIMDTNDVTTAKKVWRWNLNGLGYSKNGVNGPFETAITQDGQIVADFITTGKLNTNVIEGWESLILSVSNKADKTYVDTKLKTSDVISGKPPLLLENSGGKDLIEFEIDGNSKQDVEPSPDNPQEIQVIEGIENVFDGEIVIGGYNTTTGVINNITTQIRNVNPIYVKPNTKYLFSIDGKKINQQPRYFYYDKENNLLGTDVPAAGEFTTPENTYYINWHSSALKNLYGIELHNPMIEKGSIVHPYVPFGNYLVVKNVGVNFFDGKLTTGGYNTTTGSASTSTSLRRNENPIKVAPNEKYIFSNNGVGIGMNVYEYDENLNFLKYDGAISANSYFQVSEGTHYINFYRSNSSVDKIQLNKGENILPYKEYKESISYIPLKGNFIAKISDVKDRLYLKNGHAYIEKYIKKIILTGDEDFVRGNPNYRYYFSLESQCNLDYVPMCTHYSGKQNTDIINKCIALQNVDSTTLRINIYDDSYVNNVTSFKSFIKQQYDNETPIIIYYVLATPEIIDLGEVSISTLKGTNHLYIISNLDTDYASCKYYLDTEFTEVFTTQQETQAMIKISENEIQNLLSKKVSTDDFNTTIEEVNNSITQQITDSENSIKLEVKNEINTSIKSITPYYTVSTSNTTAPSSGWSTTVPTRATNQFVWRKDLITYLGGTTEYTLPYVVTGDKGNDGTTGTGVESITTQFYLSNSKTARSGGSWVTTMPSWSKGKYLWTRNKIVYKNPTSTVYTEPVCDSSYDAVNEVEAQLELKVGKNENDQIVSMLNASANEITFKSNRLVIESTKFKLTKEGVITATSGTIGGFTISEDELYSKHVGTYTFKQADLTKLQNYFMGSGTLTNSEKTLYDVNGDGKVDNVDYIRIRKAINSGNPTMSGKVELSSKNMYSMLRIKDNNENIVVDIGINGIEVDERITANSISSQNEITTKGLRSENGDVLVGIDSAGNSLIQLNSTNGNIKCTSLTQTSLESQKKNFEKFTNALEEIEKTDIYKYHLKNEDEKSKKHLGFVIGDKYNYSKEITSTDDKGNDVGVDTYSMISLCLQAIKELNSKIDILESKIKGLEGGE